MLKLINGAVQLVQVVMIQAVEQRSPDNAPEQEDADGAGEAPVSVEGRTRIGYSTSPQIILISSVPI